MEAHRASFYYNATIQNPGGTDGTINAVPAAYGETRAVPILRDTTNWKVGLSRLTSYGATAALPLWEAPIVPGTENVTPYKFTIGASWTGTAKAVPVTPDRTGFNTQVVLGNAITITGLNDTIDVVVTYASASGNLALVYPVTIPQGLYNPTTMAVELQIAIRAAVPALDMTIVTVTSGRISIGLMTSSSTVLRMYMSSPQVAGYPVRPLWTTLGYATNNFTNNAPFSFLYYMAAAVPVTASYTGYTTGSIPAGDGLYALPQLAATVQTTLQESVINMFASTDGLINITNGVNNGFTARYVPPVPPAQFYITIVGGTNDTLMISNITGAPTAASTYMLTIPAGTYTLTEIATFMTTTVRSFTTQAGAAAFSPTLTFVSNNQSALPSLRLTSYAGTGTVFTPSVANGQTFTSSLMTTLGMPPPSTGAFYYSLPLSGVGYGPPLAVSAIVADPQASIVANYDKKITIPSGNYAGTELATVLQAAIQASSAFFSTSTVTFDGSKFQLVLAGPGTTPGYYLYTGDSSSISGVGFTLGITMGFLGGGTVPSGNYQYNGATTIAQSGPTRGASGVINVGLRGALGTSTVTYNGTNMVVALTGPGSIGGYTVTSRLANIYSGTGANTLSGSTGWNILGFPATTQLLAVGTAPAVPPSITPQLRMTTFTASAPVIWRPQHRGDPSKYLQATSYQHVCNLVNETFRGLMANLNAQMITWGAVPFASQTPYMSWDGDVFGITVGETFIPELDATQAGATVDGVPGTESLSLWQNVACSQWLPFAAAANYDFDSVTIRGDGATVEIDTGRYTPVVDPVSGVITAGTVSQEWNATASWCPYVGLTIVSSSIPATAELMGKTIVTSGTSAAPTVGDNSRTILFDMDLQGTAAHDYLTGISFSPMIMRYAPLMGSSLGSINFQCLLRRRDGTYDAWSVPSYGCIDLKLKFEYDDGGMAED